MKISYNWLKDHINITDTPDKISDLLTRSGLEVEGVEEFESIKGSLEGIVIGEVLTCEKHPGADKLSKTTVDLGNDTIKPIVCGAPNVATGQKVVVATVGCTLYPGEGEPFKIKKAKIRGEVSEGMICAEDELGLGNSHEGIILLDTDLANGTPASQYFNISKDSIFEIGLTPNRVDGASHLGAARDLQALTDSNVIKSNNDVTFTSDAPVEVSIENLKDCQRYAGVCISGIKVSPSPEWLQLKLKSIGLAPINNVVDATNYILHDLGQPLHAFDLEKITSKKIVIKNLADKTKFTTLDDAKREISAADLMVCDDSEPMCFAGVFGGSNSGVQDTTTSIFLESAYFSPEAVRKTSQTHLLKTDSAFRFERGTDPNMVIPALKKAAQLICELTGGSISSKCYDEYPTPIENFKVETSISRIEQLIGKSIGEETITKILTDLEIEIVSNENGQLNISVPPYRVDVQREADIVEEVLRIYGYDNIELSNSLASHYLAPKAKNDQEDEKSLIGNTLSAQGFQEIITNSLTKESYTENVNSFSNEENVVILNKLSEDLGILRQSMLHTGLEVISHNINRRQSNLKLYEFGKTYQKAGDKYKETEHISLYACGNQKEESWNSPSEKMDFHFIAEKISIILDKFGITNFETTATENELLSYGIDITVNKNVIGFVGEVKKSELKKTGVKQSVFYADLLLGKLLKGKSNKLTFNEISKFPEVRRDLSLVLEKKVSFAEIQAVAQRTERKILKDINVFDTYEGDNIGESKKSYSVNFTLQDQNNTLTDKVIDKTMNKLIQAFEKELDALIRK